MNYEPQFAPTSPPPSKFGWQDRDMVQKQRATQEYESMAKGGLIAARDRGALEITLDRCGSAIDELQDAINNLEGRLQQVMLPEPPQAVGVPAPGGPTFSPAVGHLQNLVDRVNNQRHRINAIAQRLDL